MEEKTVLAHLFGHGADPVVWWRKASRYASVLGVINGKRWVVKLPVYDRLGQLNEADRRRETEYLNTTSKEFLKRLRDWGVALPETYDIGEVDGFPIHLVSDEGSDCSAYVTNNAKRLPHVLTGSISTLRAMLTSRDLLDAGIDARLSNFATKDGRKVAYIDVFPPLIKLADGYQVHYPNPTDPDIVSGEVERKFTPFGILRRLRFDLISANPDWESMFFTCLVDQLGAKKGLQMIRQFNELPDSRLPFLDRPGKLRLLESVPSQDVDTLRELAARLIPHGEYKTKVMEEVFTLTSRSTTVAAAEHEERVARFRQLMAKII